MHRVYERGQQELALGTGSAKQAPSLPGDGACLYPGGSGQGPGADSVSCPPRRVAPKLGSRRARTTYGVPVQIADGFSGTL